MKLDSCEPTFLLHFMQLIECLSANNSVIQSTNGCVNWLQWIKHHSLSQLKLLQMVIKKEYTKMMQYLE